MIDNKFRLKSENIELLVDKHGTHDQKTHGNWATGGIGQAIMLDVSRIDVLMKKGQEIYAAQVEIMDKYPDIGYVTPYTDTLKDMSKEDQKKWLELEKQGDATDNERATIYDEYFDNTLEMKSGNAANGPDMGFENESFMAIRDEYVMPDERTLKTNASLRSTGGVTAKVKRIDSLVEQGEVIAPMRVYRGAVLGPEQVDTLKVGTSFVDRGFQSSGIGLDDAEFYLGERARDIAGAKVIFHYDLQAGLNAVNVGGFEVLIQRGAKVTITGKSKKGSITTINAEVSKP